MPGSGSMPAPRVSCCSRSRSTSSGRSPLPTGPPGTRNSTNLSSRRKSLLRPASARRGRLLNQGGIAAAEGESQLDDRWLEDLWHEHARFAGPFDDEFPPYFLPETADEYFGAPF